ncbi:MAG: 3-isopropylmalate dehydratase small subunit [Candidatus Omnitrophota bacterium]
MTPFTTHTGVVAPLDRKNVDTDLIIPKQFLKKIERVGFGKHLFHEIRFKDYEGTIENPEFVLNQEPFRNASILLARDNFGCGSSREHAPWALSDYGFKVIIAPSFADIFCNNSFKNGILLVRLKSNEVDALFQEVRTSPGIKFTADLHAQTIVTPDGKKFLFDISPFAKEFLLKGLDQIGWTLQFSGAIDKFEARMAQERPWLA